MKILHYWNPSVFLRPRKKMCSEGMCCFLEEVIKHNVPEIMGLFSVCQSGFVDLEKLLILPQKCFFVIMIETITLLGYSEKESSWLG